MKLTTPDGTVYAIDKLRFTGKAERGTFFKAHTIRPGSYLPTSITIDGCILSLDSGDIAGVAMVICGVEILGSEDDDVTLYKVLLTVPVGMRTK